MKTKDGEFLAPDTDDSRIREIMRREETGRGEGRKRE